MKCHSLPCMLIGEFYVKSRLNSDKIRKKCQLWEVIQCVRVFYKHEDLNSNSCICIKICVLATGNSRSMGVETGGPLRFCGHILVPSSVRDLV